MDTQTLTNFFMWCSLINFGILLFVTFFILMLSGDFVYRMHSKVFPMPRDTFNIVMYSFLGIYKILLFVFNIVPWIALLIVG